MLLSDIYVFMTYADIQTGLYAVTSCLANGAKVYCRSNLYYSLTQYGFKVFDIDSLTILPPAEFSTIAKSDQIKKRNAYFQNYKNFRLEEHTSELQSLMQHSYAHFCLKK